MTAETKALLDELARRIIHRVSEKAIITEPGEVWLDLPKARAIAAAELRQVGDVLDAAQKVSAKLCSDTESVNGVDASDLAIALASLGRKG